MSASARIRRSALAPADLQDGRQREGDDQRDGERHHRGAALPAPQRVRFQLEAGQEEHEAQTHEREDGDRHVDVRPAEKLRADEDAADDLDDDRWEDPARDQLGQQRRRRPRSPRRSAARRNSTRPRSPPEPASVCAATVGADVTPRRARRGGPVGRSTSATWPAPAYGATWPARLRRDVLQGVGGSAKLVAEALDAAAAEQPAGTVGQEDADAGDAGRRDRPGSGEQIGETPDLRPDRVDPSTVDGNRARRR